MREVQDIKEILNEEAFQKRTKANPKKIYCFLFCTDGDEAFRQFIKKHWRTLDHLSGKSCDIFTFERQSWVHPADKLKSAQYQAIEGSGYGQAGVVPAHRVRLQGPDVAVDAGLLLLDREQCIDMRRRMFETPHKIILPGFAIFPNITEKRARYYGCLGLKDDDLWQRFQIVLGTIESKYEIELDGTAVYDAFVRSERIRGLKEHVENAVLKLSLLDLIKGIGAGLNLVRPSLKGEV